MMDMIASLPNRPLTAAEVEQIRAWEGIDRLVTCNPRGDDGVRTAVAVVGSVVVAITLDDHGWIHEVFAREAAPVVLVKTLVHRFQE